MASLRKSKDVALFIYLLFGIGRENGFWRFTEGTYYYQYQYQRRKNDHKIAFVVDGRGTVAFLLWFALPYHHATMSVDCEAILFVDRICYTVDSTLHSGLKVDIVDIVSGNYRRKVAAFDNIARPAACEDTIDCARFRLGDGFINMILVLFSNYYAVHEELYMD